LSGERPLWHKPTTLSKKALSKESSKKARAKRLKVNIVFSLALRRRKLNMIDVVECNRIFA